MISITGTQLHRLNLIRVLREREMRSERRRRMGRILGAGCFGFLVLSLVYSAFTILQMEQVLEAEKDKLQRLQAEYRKYTAARLIVDKADLDLLNGLQQKGIFWTRKLTAIAKHLPDDYVINKLRYDNGELSLTGTGAADSRQDFPLVLQDYLEALRNDTAFSDPFSHLFLNKIARTAAEDRIEFEVSASDGKRRTP